MSGDQSNIMQRVYDALDTENGTSVHDLMQKARCSRSAVVDALKRLQRQRALEVPADCVRGVWLYRRRKDALRPMDRRGAGRKQMEQEAA